MRALSARTHASSHASFVSRHCICSSDAHPSIVRSCPPRIIPKVNILEQAVPSRVGEPVRLPNARPADWLPLGAYMPGQRARSGRMWSGGWLNYDTQVNTTAAAYVSEVACNQIQLGLSLRVAFHSHSVFMSSLVVRFKWRRSRPLWKPTATDH
jgi:hypothetical protein